MIAERTRVPTGIFALAFVACLAYYRVVGAVFVERLQPMGMAMPEITARVADCTKWLWDAYNVTLSNALGTDAPEMLEFVIDNPEQAACEVAEVILDAQDP